MNPEVGPRAVVGEGPRMEYRDISERQSIYLEDIGTLTIWTK